MDSKSPVRSELQQPSSTNQNDDGLALLEAVIRVTCTARSQLVRSGPLHRFVDERCLGQWRNTEMGL